MADNKKLQDVMGVTMDKVKGMIDADSIIGKPINLEDG
ncbi:MAG TPA: sporulation protein YtfJ, partial [Candidatus Faecivivens stercoripullorum]|nr:sporulation protein YtfJ [Candidatus Faecivivens stercoripullorum]